MISIKKFVKGSVETMPPKTQLYSDILCTAYEGGIDYWAACRNVERDGNGEYLSFEVRDCEDRTEPWVPVNIENVRTAVNKIITKQTKISDDYRDTIKESYDENDASNIDAGLADYIVQIAAFGELAFS